MLGIRLEPELESRLEKLARKRGRSESYYAREAIRQYLEDRGLTNLAAHTGSWTGNVTAKVVPCSSDELKLNAPPR